MDDAFELLDPRNAQAFLKQVSAEARRKGEACFRRGAVQNLVPEEPGSAYSAQVKDGETHEVDLEYEPAEGWSGSCTCELEFDCEHVVAAMRALLAEHSRAAVRSLSASGPSASAALAASRSKPAAADVSELVRRLMATRKRPLKPEERKFLAKVRTVYARCRQSGHITHWDFEEMGLRLGGYGWNALQIWPAVPGERIPVLALCGARRAAARGADPRVHAADHGPERHPGPRWRAGNANARSNDGRRSSATCTCSPGPTQSEDQALTDLRC